MSKRINHSHTYLYSIFYLMCACHHESKTRNVLLKVSFQEYWLAIMLVDGRGDRLPDSGTKGVSWGWGKRRSGGGFALTARHMEGCRFPSDRENGILNAYLRCYRWRSQRQRILYKAFWKAPLIFHQNCVYARKQTKKEVCSLNPPRSLSLTHTHICSVLYFWSLFTHSFFHFTVSPTSPSPTLDFCSLVITILPTALANQTMIWVFTLG